jgi:hypothetical protein
MRLLCLCTSSCCEFVDGASTVCCCFAPMVPCAQDGVLIPRSLSYTVYTAHRMVSRFVLFSPVIRRKHSADAVSKHAGACDQLLCAKYRPILLSPRRTGKSSQIAVGLLEGIVPEDHPIQQLRGSAVFVEGPEIHRYGAAVTVSAGVVCEVLCCTGRVTALSVCAETSA